MDNEIVAIDAKLDKLMTAYLENALTLPEYQETKNKLVAEKHTLKEKIDAFGRVSTNRFEPLINFLKDCKEATILAESNDTAKIRTFFEKVGSNPLVRNRTLVFSPRLPYALVTHIPEKIRIYAGGATGGVWGGMSPRPPHVVIRSPFCLQKSELAKLLPGLESNQD